MEKIFKYLTHRLKRFINVVFDKDFYPKIDLVCDCERLGTEYGGWIIAKGKIREDSVVYAFGVGEDISFDLGLIEKYGITIHGFDPTPKSIRWVRGQNLPEKFIFHEYGIADIDGVLTFHPPANPEHASYSLVEKTSDKNDPVQAPVKRLKTIMDELGHQKVDVLKMDIEGAEYQVIKDMDLAGIRPTQVLVEFHHRFPGVGLRKTKDAVNRLCEIGYGLFSVSPNGEEYSFMLKD